MNDQNKKTTDKQSLLDRLGEYALEGGPGRPKGSKNKYTLLKEEILEVWEEERGKERFKALFTGSTRDFTKALEIILSLIPKEQPEEVSGPVKYIVSWQSNEDRA